MEYGKSTGTLAIIDKILGEQAEKTVFYQQTLFCIRQMSKPAIHRS